MRFRRDNDLDAARELVLSHLRFVVHIARGYAGYGLPMNDLVQEGNIGLMKAVKRFDPSVGVRLVSFAVHWIRAEIHEYVLRNWRLVKVATTKAQRKLFFNLRRMKTNLTWLTRRGDARGGQGPGRHPGGGHRDGAAAVGARSVVRCRPRCRRRGELRPGVLSAGGRCRSGRTGRGRRVEQLLARAAVGGACERLDDRSRTILQRRWMSDDKATLHELAAEYGVSAERIRQIEAGAMTRLEALLPAPA